MVNLVLLALVAGALAAYELPPLVRRSRWGELAVVAVILALGVALSLPHVLGRRVPGPFDAMEAVLHWLRELVAG